MITDLMHRHSLQVAELIRLARAELSKYMKPRAVEEVVNDIIQKAARVGNDTPQSCDDLV